MRQSPWRYIKKAWLLADLKLEKSIPVEQFMNRKTGEIRLFSEEAVEKLGREKILVKIKFLKRMLGRIKKANPLIDKLELLAVKLATLPPGEGKKDWDKEKALSVINFCEEIKQNVCSKCQSVSP